MNLKPLRVLFIGNSYSECTCAYFYDFLEALGLSGHNIASLKLSGCTLDMHWNNARNNAPAYRFFHYTSSGDRTVVEPVTLRDGIPTDQWDWVVLSDSSATQSRPSAFAHFQELIDYVKPLVTPGKTKYAFNMTWPWEVGSAKFDCGLFDRDPAVMFRATCETIRQKVLSNPDIVCILPTGSAIWNAVRSVHSPVLYRDGGHLNANGCYLAGLAALYTLLKHTEGFEEYHVRACGLPCLPDTPHRTNGSFIGCLEPEYAGCFLQAVTEAVETPFGNV